MKKQKRQHDLIIDGLIYENRKRQRFLRFGRNSRRVFGSTGTKTTLFSSIHQTSFRPSQNLAQKFSLWIILIARLTFRSRHSSTSKWVWPPVSKRFLWLRQFSVLNHLLLPVISQNSRGGISKCLLSNPTPM